jgi:hypothetical protein
MLVRLGWLRDADAVDPRCVSRAITALLSDTAKTASRVTTSGPVRC